MPWHPAFNPPSELTNQRMGSHLHASLTDSQSPTPISSPHPQLSEKNPAGVGAFHPGRGLSRLVPNAAMGDGRTPENPREKSPRGDGSAESTLPVPTSTDSSGFIRSARARASATATSSAMWQSLIGWGAVSKAVRSPRDASGWWAGVEPTGGAADGVGGMILGDGRTRVAASSSGLVQLLSTSSPHRLQGSTRG